MLLFPIMSITEFKGAYHFLSNFAVAPVVYEGMLFPTVEHAYQAAKTLDWNSREEIRKAYSAGKAKQMGKRVLFGFTSWRSYFVKSLTRSRIDLCCLRREALPITDLRRRSEFESIRSRVSVSRIIVNAVFSLTVLVFVTSR